MNIKPQQTPSEVLSLSKSNFDNEIKWQLLKKQPNNSIDRISLNKNRCQKKPTEGIRKESK
jgi:hypothetical protein